MEIILISDLHGWLPKIETPFDLLGIAGDVSPAHDHYYKFQKEWTETTFKDWVLKLPFKNELSKVVLVPGNHDAYFERANKTDISHLVTLCDNRLVFLKNQTYDFETLDGPGLATIKIFGTPYCKIFGGWPFMCGPDTLAKKYGECPEGMDLVLSHDSPKKNNLGLIQEGWSSGTDAGNALLDELIDAKKPKVFVSGHIHSGNHEFANVDGVWMGNVSLINERYYPTYDVLYINYNPDVHEVVEHKKIQVESEEANW